ncbi:hypothetical protein SAMN05444411_101894 [Lutibacter oricola]|uniref:Lipoprotein n=1 Tax=Lutibacter oricola TaxID=762486 RepID=A0A1H2U685_9FLAO|nr:hypothetical protein [Lutibacter oricola]SDW51437.1 hypothetical protein SAMN05444411_101894 [Lutibacter oricola]
MRNLPKILVVLALLFIVSCKNTSKEKKINSTKTKVENKALSDAEKTAIVKYYLTNDRKLSEKDIFKIIFLNDGVDNVKVIHYEGRDSFFTFKFSKAQDYYTKHFKK